MTRDCTQNREKFPPVERPKPEEPKIIDATKIVGEAVSETERGLGRQKHQARHTAKTITFPTAKAQGRRSRTGGLRGGADGLCEAGSISGRTGKKHTETTWQLIEAPRTRAWDNGAARFELHRIRYLGAMIQALTPNLSEAEAELAEVEVDEAIWANIRLPFATERQFAFKLRLAKGLLE